MQCSSEKFQPVQIEFLTKSREGATLHNHNQKGDTFDCKISMEGQASQSLTEDVSEWVKVEGYSKVSERQYRFQKKESTTQPNTTNVLIVDPKDFGIWELRESIRQSTPRSDMVLLREDLSQRLMSMLIKIYV